MLKINIDKGTSNSIYTICTGSMKNNGTKTNATIFKLTTFNTVKRLLR